MSRCASCNCILTSQEMSMKGVHSHSYLGLCYRCAGSAEIEYESDGTLSNSDAPDEFEPEEDVEDE